jgi:hypothetical protein
MKTTFPAASYKMLVSVDKARNDNAPGCIYDFDVRHRAGNIEASTNGKNFSTPDEDIHIPKSAGGIHISVFYKYHAHLLLLQ